MPDLLSATHPENTLNDFGGKDIELVANIVISRGLALSGIWSWALMLAIVTREERQYTVCITQVCLIWEGTVK